MTDWPVTGLQWTTTNKYRGLVNQLMNFLANDKQMTDSVTDWPNKWVKWMNELANDWLTNAPDSLTDCNVKLTKRMNEWMN